MNYPAASCGGIKKIIYDYLSEVVTPECLNRGSSQNLDWIPA
jgi:hypothetical protein